MKKEPKSPIHTCYVCKKRIKPTQVLVQAGLFSRHNRCEVGSYNWWKSDFSKTSKLKHLYVR